MSVIALLSDLGYNDTSVARIKSNIWKGLPDAKILDITHNIRPFYLRQAAYLLSSAVNNFSVGTYTLVVFDIYYAKQPVFVLAEIDGQYIIAPDNGILPLALMGRNYTTWLCHSVTDTDNLGSIINAVTQVIEKTTESTPQEVLEEYSLKNKPALNVPKVYENYLECSVVHIDRFENVVLNVTKEEFDKAAKGRSFTIQFVRDETITNISTQYSSVAVSDKLCKFNSVGYLEIAIRNGNAAGLFGFKLMEERQMGYDTIKISFE